MYQELILVLIIIFVIYFVYFYDTRINYKAFNHKYYKIRNCNDENLKQKKADYLARIDDKAKNIIQYMYDNNLPDKEVSSITHKRYKNSDIGETPIGDSSAAYTINKGPIYVCIMNEGKFNDENDTFFVILHELAHVMSNSYGHGKEFQKNFNYIVKLAIKLKYWEDKKYEKTPMNFCGTSVTRSPCSDGSCKNLDDFFKQDLTE